MRSTRLETRRLVDWCVCHSFHLELSSCNVHDRHTRNLANSLLEVLVAGGYNIASVDGDAVNDTVIGIRSFVAARQPLKLPGETKSNSPFFAHLLPVLSMNTIQQLRSR